ncbi:MAG: serine/threonine protein kinase [Gammaproteobacteria bacterium]
MNNNLSIPYDSLDPDMILTAIENAGLHCDGSLHTLNSYENRVYQIGIENAAPIIAKFYRPQRWTDEAILEEHQFALELMEHEIPVVAPFQHGDKTTLHHFKQFRFALFPRWGGHALEIDNLQQLEWMGRFIGRMHAISSCRPFQHRQQLNIKNMGYDSYQYIITHDFLPSYLYDNYCNIVETALQKIEARLQLVNSRSIRLHGDIHAGNVLWNDAGPHIVDLDDCMMGPAIQDIWMLLSGDEHQIHIEIEHILRGYREFHDFNQHELILIEALRTLRMLHYSAWIAKRWLDPAFPANFPWFNTPQYWQQQLQNLSEQVSLLDEILPFN